MAAEPLPVVLPYIRAVEQVVDEADPNQPLTIFDEQQLLKTVHRVIELSNAPINSRRDRRQANREACYHLGLLMQWHGIDRLN